MLPPHLCPTTANKLKRAPTGTMMMLKSAAKTPSCVSKRLCGNVPALTVFSAALLSLILLTSPFPAPQSAWAQAKRPYDPQILRLSEILGAVHYLRELCGSGDGQLWREQMRTLIGAEGSTALRRARLTRSFNNGYRSYSRTYKVCTASAKTAIERFLTEGTEIAEKLIKSNR